MQTPLWVPLAVAAMGFAGIVITQYLAIRRDDKQWNRERDRERERWQREDVARTFEQRRTAYFSFYEELRVMTVAIQNGSLAGDNVVELPDDWDARVYEKRQILDFYAVGDLGPAADRALDALWVYGKSSLSGGKTPAVKEAQEAYYKAELEVLTLMRKDLAIPGSASDASSRF
jgi:hypothetical protein